MRSKEKVFIRVEDLRGEVKTVFAMVDKNSPQPIAQAFCSWVVETGNRGFRLVGGL